MVELQTTSNSDTLMDFYINSFIVTLLLSTLFATGGVGSAIVLIPLLSFLGVGFDLSKAVGLFVNTVTTSTASCLNFRRNAIDVKTTIPFLFTSVLLAPVGAYSAHHCNISSIKILFILFLFLSAYMMFSRQADKLKHQTNTFWSMSILGVGVGFFAGLLGIGGGALIIPSLYYMHFPPKKIAATVSFMIPFSTFIAFCSYVVLVEIDWFLIGITTVAALLGGIIGTKIMHKHLQDRQMKNLLAVILCIVAIKMICDLLII